MTARFLALYETPADPEGFDRHYRLTYATTEYLTYLTYLSR
jgi:hypothetical protein